MFIPTTSEELETLGWDELDVILVTGDTYIDSPSIGAAVVGKTLVEAGYRVGIVAQPDIRSGEDITRLGEPRLFWGVTGGCIDSMVANHTATGRRRRRDDYTPGGVNDRRPDRAVIVYANLIREHFKQTVPIVLGGIEASLRRIAHYDFWSDRIRRSVLFDAKADYLVYGMAEKTVVALADALQRGGNGQDVLGLCYVSREGREGYVELPPFDLVARDKHAFAEMFHQFYVNSDPQTASGLQQKQDTRYLIHNPPASYLTRDELDAVYAMDFEREVHPYYKRLGEVRAMDTIRFSIAAHRGCYGECNFCSIAVHEGRTIRWRSHQSVLKEARALTARRDFKGIISDVGGPTANMYGFECAKKLASGSCERKRCVFPSVCPQLKPNHESQTALLRSLRKLPGVKKVFVASGVRYDLVLADRRHGRKYLDELVRHHVSGQMKVAPEHSETCVLDRMGKPRTGCLLEFRKMFSSATNAAGKEQYLTYYLMAAHPGCSERDMKRLRSFVQRRLGINPEQVQIFTPLPSTYSSVMYYTDKDPFSGEKLFVEKEPNRRQEQKRILTAKPRD